MPPSARWETIRRLAADEWSVVSGQWSAEILRCAQNDRGAAIRNRLRAQGLEVFALPSNDPMLGGARAVFDREFVAYDAGLPTQVAAFSLAHELGHTLLHGGHGGCSATDIDEAGVVAFLAPVPGGVESYSPRQQREREANAFAAAFLMPPDEILAAFAHGQTYADLAAHYGVSESAMLNTLAAVSGQWSVVSGQRQEESATQNSKPWAGSLKTQNFALDASQQAAATVAEGPVLIDAGPGTGKTRTLIERVLFLLREGTPPEEILALTFSNRAANEMRERLRLAAPDAADTLTVGTFHAFCLGFLQEHAAEVGLPLGVTLIDDVQAAAWLELRLGEMGLEHYASLWEPARYLPDMLGAISRARDELVDAAAYAELAKRAAEAAAPNDEKAQTNAARWAEVARVYGVYERLLEEKGALDFGGLLLRTVELLRAQPDLLEQLSGRYRHILVDEYQDMNRASGVLLGLLAGDGRGLWVVGDLRQAIYRFRGASPANLTQFEHDFPGGRRMRLGVNYRSDPAIVGLFSTLGEDMPMPGTPKAAWETQRPPQPGPRIWLAEAGDAASEAAGILAEIRRRAKAGRPLNEQAVLCRTHGQATLIARALEAADLPTLYIGNIFERDEVRDLLALVSLAAEADGRGLLRAVGFTRHAADRSDCARLVRYARDADVPFPRALGLAGEAGLPAEMVAACGELAAAIDAAGPHRAAWDFLARFMFGPLSPVRRLSAESTAGAAGKLAAMGSLLTLARSFDEIEGAKQPDEAERSPLRGFLAHVRRLYAAKEAPGRTPTEVAPDAVRVMTVHASKGLEFPVVYLPGLAAGRFPFREMWEACPPPPRLVQGAADEEGDHLLEESCLFFVALSRARDELVLSRAARYGKQAAKPSPLLDNLAPYFERVPPERLHWPSADAEMVTEPETAPGDAGDEALTVEDLEQYLRCPRQYEYSRVLRLAEGEATGYLRFYRVVKGLVGKLRDAHAKHALPDEAGALEMLATEWEAGGPLGHTHEALYAKEARHLVTLTRQRLAAAPPEPEAQDEFQVPLGGAHVRLRLDRAEAQADGGVRLVRQRIGKLNDEDRKSPRLALARVAARAEFGPDVPLTVAVESLETGETMEVPDSRYEAARVAKLGAAVAGIRAARFPPAPAEADGCLRCPFWIICPA
ncbi:MAG: UvrD-helicase domain-containing protein [Chloroflexia bacterium]